MRADPGVVVVSGGASGLGAAVVRAVAEARGTPLVLDLRPPDRDAEHAVVDLTRPREAEAAVRELAQLHGGLDGVVTTAGIDVRSEEHTSELQSRFDLVCRLLLEK